MRQEAASLGESLREVAGPAGVGGVVEAFVGAAAREREITAEAHRAVVSTFEQTRDDAGQIFGQMAGRFARDFIEPVRRGARGPTSGRALRALARRRFGRPRGHDDPGRCAGRHRVVPAGRYAAVVSAFPSSSPSYQTYMETVSKLA